MTYLRRCRRWRQVNIDVKIQEEPTPGQVWKHDTLRNYKIKILAANDRHLEVECIESQIDGIKVGDKSVLEEDVLYKYYTKCNSSIKQLHGESCIKCKRYYPHAPKQTNFVCWGCKNGV